MVDLSCFERAGRALQDSVRRYLTLASREDLERWLVSVESAITELENIIKNVHLTRGEKQKCQTCMSHFLSIRQQLTKRIQRLELVQQLGVHGEFRPQQQPEELQQPAPHFEPVQQFEVLGGELRRPQQQPEVLQPPVLQSSEHPNVSWDYFESAFANRIRSGVITNLGALDIHTLMKEAKTIFIQKISEVLEEHPSIKVNTDLVADSGVVKEGEEVTEPKYFSTENGAIYSSTNLEEWFEENVQDPIAAELEDFQQSGSGWTLNFILRLVVNINKYNPLRASSWIDLPDQIKNKHAAINVKNEGDHECFKLAILSALHPCKYNYNSVSSYKKFEKELNFSGINFPVVLKDVPKFEKLNQISVNVYMLKLHGKSFRVSPCHLTDAKQEKHVNLLILQDRYTDEDGETDELEDEDGIFN